MVKFIIKKQLFMICFNKINTFGNCKQKTTFQIGSFTHFPIPKPTHIK